ncbi:hypothetical protein CVT26_003759 [Gymnopilus dilepis]|uniref:F-box domain-containing protein n=1 Tax=Gymnopilus dilepis TaxID=231916 RepID=A0A409VRZ1_9AGAR|nr:hypothetical protein CVT26_003759 [Gymnopilus dilepis]
MPPAVMRSVVFPNATALSPIYKLDYDILWTIFCLNANMDSAESCSASPTHSAFDATLYSSQVCRVWRDILLDSPTIWGNALCIDRLTNLKDEGRKEILKRTGVAVLCLRGRLGGSPESYSFFAAVLDSELWRIRKIDVMVSCDYEYGKAWRELFQRPARQLKSFKLSFQFHYGGCRTTASEEMILFGGEAPALQEFHAKNLNVNLCLPWTLQLRSLRLMSCEQRADDILQALQYMPLLEYLELGIAYRSPSHFPAERSINLPNLSQLHLSSSLGISLAVAHAIAPSDGCVLTWSSKLTPAELLTLQDVTRLQGVLGRYCRLYFKARQIKCLTLCQDLHTFNFRAEPFPTTDHLQIDFSSRLSEAWALSFLLHPVVQNDFTSVDTFRFRPGFFSDVSSNVVDFLKSLVSVVNLDISERGFGVLFAQSNKNEVIFPSLQRLTIQLACSPDAETVSRVLAFLAYRRECGHPISVLDLSTDGDWGSRSEPMQLGNWSPLEALEGLKVVWQKDSTKFEYFCGTNCPEQLVFSSSYGDDVQFSF